MDETLLDDAKLIEAHGLGPTFGGSGMYHLSIASRMEKAAKRQSADETLVTFCAAALTGIMANPRRWEDMTTLSNELRIEGTPIETVHNILTEKNVHKAFLIGKAMTDKVLRHGDGRKTTEEIQKQS